SSGPPGAWTTPSTEMKAPPTSLRIRGTSPARRLDRGDVDLLHRHHRLHRARGGLAVRVVHRLHQRARGDLPGEAPAVPAPAALAFAAAVADDGVPVAVGFGLVFGQDHEADRLVGLEL